MKFRPIKQAPVLIATGVIGLICLTSTVRFDLVARLENMTYDWRARRTLQHPLPGATNLGFVTISDDTITALSNGSLDFRFGLYWPRQIYGRALRELSAQGAKAVAFDVLFANRRRDHPHVPVSAAQWPDLPEFLSRLHPGQAMETYELNGETMTVLESDEYFAWQLDRSGRAIIAAEKGVQPHWLFADHALLVGDISAEPDPDGVLRRARAFHDYRRWHRAFKQVEADKDFAVDLNNVVLQAGKIILKRGGLPDITIPVDAQNNFQLTDFSTNLPAGAPRTAKAFTDERVWHVGILLAARELGINLAEAAVDLPHGRITFRGANGAERILPVDRNGYFYINWELTAKDPRLTAAPFERLLQQDRLRTAGSNRVAAAEWQDQLVVVGSNATGNDLTDRGATPLEKSALLVSKHWNVANSIITGRFIQPVARVTEFSIIILLGILTALLTWQLRVLPALICVLLLAITYSLAAVYLFVAQRYWLPLVLPVTGSLFVQYGLLVTYRAVFEQQERRRVKSVFSRIVAPEVVNELLRAESLALGGARREVTVLFADVRGFTELTDEVQEQIGEFVTRQGLTGAQAEACFDEVAEQTLQTISLYLGLIADIVKKHGGTLDKYIGDCAMAFWGAPRSNSQHALRCVHAAIEAQRSIHALNLSRQAENDRLQGENQSRAAAGLGAKPLLPVLSLGTGINTGAAMVGLMGSDQHGLNYTVLGREVNLASRLEGLSGRGRIIIGEETYRHLQRDDPALAARCMEQEPTTPKGFHRPVRNFEVPWDSPGV